MNKQQLVEQHLEVIDDMGNFDPQKRKTGLPRLIEIAGTKKWWLFGSMFLALCAAVAQFVPYVAVFKILTELAAHASTPHLVDKALVWRWGYLSFGSICLYGLLLYASYMLSHIAAFNILYETRLAISRKLVRIPLGFFTKRASGDIKKVMAEDVERIELFVAHHVPDIITALVFPVLTLGFLFMADWRLALVVLAVFGLALAIQFSMLLSPKARVRMADYHAALGRMNAGMVEYVRGIQVVKVFNRSMEAFERLRHDIFAYRDYAIGVTNDFAFTYTGFLAVLSSPLLFLIPVATLLLLGAPLYADYIPTVFLFLILGAGVFFPLLKLMWIGSLLTQNSVGVGLIDEILDKPEISEPIRPKKPVGTSVEFHDVSFGYNDELVLRNISFTAQPGTVTALVGPSGAGKSTVGMLTARFWDVLSGEIRIGGVAIKDISMEDLMNLVSFVFQDNPLFFDTIGENIRMGNLDATPEEVASAARTACCEEFITGLANGYGTLVGEGGTYLSGGEQQRLALARAILKNTPIIVLDEATAYADPENEGQILDSFSHLVKGRTVLVIAHRLSTIVNADWILVMDRGAIVEQGRHDVLLARDGLYARMWQAYSQAREWVIERR